MGAPKRSTPIRSYGIAAIVLCITGTIGLWWLLEADNTSPVWLGCWLATINLVTVAFYGYDKVRAYAGVGRVPEVVLHGLGALGGSPGALLAMWLFRHKTLKGSFRILFWAIVVLQISVIAYIAKLLWWG
jgi:uncharacterized membrane protein YsdA (DUF1294 family)